MMGTALPDDNYPMRRFFFKPVCNRLILRYFCRWCSWRWCPNEEGIKTFPSTPKVSTENSWRWCPNEEGIKTVRLGELLDPPLSWRWCPNEEGIKTSITNCIRPCVTLEVVP